MKPIPPISWGGGEAGSEPGAPLSPLCKPYLRFPFVLIPAHPPQSPQPWDPHPGALLTAIAMAMSASVTVSMGEEISGVFSVIFRVRAEVRS